MPISAPSLRRRLFLVLCGLACALSAHAAEPVYGGVGLAFTRYNLNRDAALTRFQLTSGAAIDDKVYGVSAYAGYRFDEHLAVQVDGSLGGTVTASDNGTVSELFKALLYSVSAVAGADLWQGLRAYVKVGATRWSLSQGSNEIVAGFAPSVGVGVDADLFGSRQRKMRIEWTRVQMSRDFMKSTDVFVLGGVLQF